MSGEGPFPSVSPGRRTHGLPGASSKSTKLVCNLITSQAPPPDPCSCQSGEDGSIQTTALASLPHPSYQHVSQLRLMVRGGMPRRKRKQAFTLPPRANIAAPMSINHLWLATQKGGRGAEAGPGGGQGNRSSGWAGKWRAHRHRAQSREGLYSESWSGGELDARH